MALSLRRRRKPGDGPYCDRLHLLLYDAGFNRTEVYLAQGYWSHRHQDVMRWTGQGEAREGNPWNLPAGWGVQFGSWDTVKACVRKGIDVFPTEHGTLGEFDVYAKG